MSIYSGKCDLKDEIDIFGIDYILKANIYVGNTGPLKVSSEIDLIPYYTHLISAAAYCKDHSTIYLSEESYLDTEERSIIDTYKKDLKKWSRKAKKENKVFDESYLDNVLADSWYKSHRDIYLQLMDNKQVHLPSYNNRRKMLLELAEEMGMEKHPVMIKFKQYISGDIDENNS